MNKHVCVSLLFIIPKIVFFNLTDCVGILFRELKVHVFGIDVYRSI